MCILMLERFSVIPQDSMDWVTWFLRSSESDRLFSRIGNRRAFKRSVGASYSAFASTPLIACRESRLKRYRYIALGSERHNQLEVLPIFGIHFSPQFRLGASEH